MSTLIDRLSKLTPEQRLLLERRLKDKQAAEPRRPEAAAGEPPWLEGEALASRFDWWRERFAAFEAPRRLAAPGRRRAGAAHASEPLAVPEGLTAELRALAGGQGVDLPVLLLAAFGALLGRYTGRRRPVVGHTFSFDSSDSSDASDGGWVNLLPVEIDLTGDPTFRELLGRVADECARAGAHADIPAGQLARELAAAGALRAGEALLPVVLRLGSEGSEAPGYELLLEATEEAGLSGALRYDGAALDRVVAQGLALHLGELLAAVAAAPDRPLSRLPLFGEELARRFAGLEAAPPDEPATGATVHALFRQRAGERPGAAAVRAEGRSVSAAEIAAQANRYAHWLRRRGVAPEDVVALRLAPSAGLVAALLGVLAAGAAAVVLEPEEAEARFADAVADVRPRWLITDDLGADLGVPRLSPAAARDEIAAESPEAPATPAGGADRIAAAVLVLDPPGGRRWVLVTHGSLCRLFAALDSLAGCGPGDVLSVLSPPGSASWLAELLWPLTRGAEVVFDAGSVETAEPEPRRVPRAAAGKGIDFSLFYFGSQEAGPGGGHDLVFEGARFADRHGFHAVWTPERHFHPFGALFPNAAVNAAALAMITRRVHLRAGSVVLPLHHPVRVAEEWALADSISRGRVGVAFASGWHSNDFIFEPDNYVDRREVMFREIETVRRLWRGEPVSFRGGAGHEVPVRIYPRPVQPELPVWITVAATPGTAGRAGEIGANVLTHLLGQGLERVKERIGSYRDGRARQGHDPQTGRVTLMLHTFLGSDSGVVRDTVRRPFSEYIRSFTGLLDSLAKSQNLGVDKEAMSEDDLESLLAFAFERYFNDSGLFGTPRSALELVRHLQEIGVDEVACLIDFGVAPEAVLAGLSYLDRLRELANRRSEPPRAGLAPVADGTPLGTAAAVVDCPSPRTARQPAAAALRLHGSAESGVWAVRVEPGSGDGDPLLVQALPGAAALVLDGGLELAPVGAEGELCVLGSGLARGYLGRPDLTADRFVPSPFGPAGGRLLRTGQRARYHADGGVEWLGLAAGQGGSR